MRKMRSGSGFKFATAKEDGSPCCAGDSVAHFCAECRAAVATTRSAEGMVSQGEIRGLVMRLATRISGAAEAKARQFRELCDHVRAHREARELEMRTPPAPIDMAERIRAGGTKPVSPAELRDRLLVEVKTRAEERERREARPVTMEQGTAPPPIDLIARVRARSA